MGEDDPLDETHPGDELRGGWLPALHLADGGAQVPVSGLGVVDPAAGRAHGRIEHVLLRPRVDVELVHDALEEILAGRFVIERRPLELQEQIAHRAVISREELGGAHG